MFVCGHAQRPYKPVQKCWGQLKRESGSFSDGQIKLHLFWKGKHRSILHGLCSSKAEHPLWIPKLNFKDYLCFVLAHYAYYRIMFPSKLLVERRTVAKYKKIDFRVLHFSSQIK